MSIPFSRSVQVQRQAAGEYVDGFWMAGKVSQLTIRAAVQPASDRDLQTLPEGTRQTETIKLYSNAELFTDREDPVRSADRVIIGGIAYKVIAIADYAALVGSPMGASHRRYLAQLDNPKTVVDESRV